MSIKYTRKKLTPSLEYKYNSDKLIFDVSSLDLAYDLTNRKTLNNISPKYHNQIFRSESLDKHHSTIVNSTPKYSALRKTAVKGSINVMFVSTCQKGVFTEKLKDVLNNKNSPLRSEGIFSKQKAKPISELGFRNSMSESNIQSNGNVSPSGSFDQKINYRYDPNRNFYHVEWPDNVNECKKKLIQILDGSIRLILSEKDKFSESINDSKKEDINSLFKTQNLKENFEKNGIRAYSNNIFLPTVEHDIEDLSIPDLICINEINKNMAQGFSEPIQLQSSNYIYSQTSDLDDLLMSTDPHYEHCMKILIKSNSEWQVSQDKLISAVGWVASNQNRKAEQNVYIRLVELINKNDVIYKIGFVHMPNELVRHNVKSTICDNLLNDLCERYKINELFGDFNQDDYFSINRQSRYKGFYHTITAVDDHSTLGRNKWTIDYNDSHIRYEYGRNSSNVQGVKSSSTDKYRYIGRMIPAWIESNYKVGHKNLKLKLRPLLGGKPINENEVYGDHAMAFGYTTIYE